MRSVCSPCRTNLAASPYLSTQERNSLFLAGRLGFAKPEANWQVSLTGSGGVHELNNQQSTLALEGNAAVQRPEPEQSG